MAKQSAGLNVKPTSDQPRATQSSTQRADVAPTLQYKTTGVKNLSRTPRQARKPARM